MNGKRRYFLNTATPITLLSGLKVVVLPDVVVNPVDIRYENIAPAAAVPINLPLTAPIVWLPQELPVQVAVCVTPLTPLDRLADSNPPCEPMGILLAVMLQTLLLLVELKFAVTAVFTSILVKSALSVAELKVPMLPLVSVGLVLPARG